MASKKCFAGKNPLLHKKKSRAKRDRDGVALPADGSVGVTGNQKKGYTGKGLKG